MLKIFVFSFIYYFNCLAVTGIVETTNSKILDKKVQVIKVVNRFSIDISDRLKFKSLNYTYNSIGGSGGGGVQMYPTSKVDGGHEL